MTTSTADRALVLLAVAGPVAFTAAWWGLGALTPGYEHPSASISAVAMLGGPYATAMLGAFLLQGSAQLAVATLLGRAGHRLVAAALSVAGVGTLAVAALPLPGTEGPAWLGRAHVVAAVVAFTGLHFGALLGSLDRRLPGWVRAVGVLALAVALPSTVLLVTGANAATGGYAEKLMTTALLVFTTAVVAVLVPPRRRVPTGGTAAVRRVP